MSLTAGNRMRGLVRLNVIRVSLGGATSDEVAELNRLKRGNAELRRANDILKAAAAFCGAEFDRRQKK